MVDLTAFAAEQQRAFDSSTTPMARKQQGHFGTPPEIASFMAGMFSRFPAGTVRVLDPGAGVGTLSAAVCQRALATKASCHLQFELWENDPHLEPYLRRTMDHCQKTLRDAAIKMAYSIRHEDFILANTAKSLFDDGPQPTFDWAILNPPYFKLRKESPHARAMPHIVHGQPNIYALFLAVSVDLLVSGGEVVAITPRSYFNGPYFKRFRKWFFHRVAARQIHVFESRTEAFRDDGVLQENVIFRGERAGTAQEVTLTTSEGRDLRHVQSISAPYDQVINNSHGDYVVRVTSNGLERAIIDTMEALPHRFHELGFEISTGPVVTFRSTEFLRSERAKDTAPLLWMHNVRPFVTRFPDLATLVKIGRCVEQQTSRDYVEIERIVGETLRLPKPLIEQLCEAASVMPPEIPFYS